MKLEVAVCLESNLTPSESKESLLERLVANAELNFKCCAGTCGHIASEDALGAGI
jgi:hypothetical protein